MKTKNGLIFLGLILSLTALARQDLSYYPEQYQVQFERGLLKDNALKIGIKEVLRRYHLAREGQSDILSSNCVPGYECYKHTILGYREARKYLFGKLHLKKDSVQGYYIEDVYCKKTFTNRSFGNGNSLGVMRIPNSNIINCEHTWPQSKFNRSQSKNMQVSDLHHLFPSDSRANSVRGNFPFAEVDGQRLKNNCDSSAVGEAIEYYDKGYRNSFEPPANHKGNVARALFYFAVKYDMKIDELQEHYLKRWHQEDPVDQEEMIRNHEIMNIQGSRNPFIDFPSLVSNISDF